MSKFSLDVLKKCVYPFTDHHDPDVLIGAVFGEDAALTKVGDDVLVSHVDPIVGAIDQIGWLAVHTSCNDIATNGVPPRWILILVLVPSSKDETLLKEIMTDINRAAEEVGVSIIGGHTGFSSGISRPLVAVTSLGTASGRQPVLTSGAQPGDHIFITKGIALEGTSILAKDFADVALERGLSKKDLTQAEQLIEQISIIPEALALAESGASAMHDVTRGGILETLLEIAHLSKVAMEVNKSDLPIPEIVALFAKTFQFEPLKMLSSGTLIATIPSSNVTVAAQKLDEIGITFADIGTVSEGEGVVLHDEGETQRYTQILAEEDELARMWTKYPR